MFLKATNNGGVKPGTRASRSRPRISRYDGSLLGSLFPGQRRDNPGRGLRSRLLGQPPIGALCGADAVMQEHRLTSWPRRLPLGSCPQGKYRLRGRPASRRVGLNTAGCQAAGDVLRLRRRTAPVTSRRQRHRRRRARTSLNILGNSW